MYGALYEKLISHLNRIVSRYPVKCDIIPVILRDNSYIISIAIYNDKQILTIDINGDEDVVVGYGDLSKNISCSYLFDIAALNKPSEIISIWKGKILFPRILSDICSYR